ncbi:ABC transporter substrate-binding protein [Aeromicrobium senzhongii]|uniref:ABC transporter substrate-binding protein n=1 Tax=Aeromicrobium senzhongii TaxID=2663859 RepID=A0ABX6SU08_9ACTN|nr:ABC transporter substrate-binding protein [Aeromicrobium senzhongii]MTB88116.1 ABC transporter substrate-binding protein [Aeromicrobium senzhongii]QNL94889.1 ABC transporter substrate-binding protein [Aeromicrobium senzhongii]
MTIRSRWGAAASAVLLTVLAACGGGGGSGDSDRALRVAAASDASSLDPIRGNAGTDHVLLYPLYDTLVSYSTGLEPEPGLAESWEQKSPTELTLKLREGLTFHDGEPLDAEAVVYNAERALGEGSNIQADLASVEKVTADDELTVTYHLKAADASLLLVLADRAGMMVSPKAAEAASGDLSTKPVGAGGWKFKEWKRGSVLKVTKFADYWDTDAERVSAIDFNIIPEPKTRVTSLRSGQQDVAMEISPSDSDALDKADNVSLDASPRVNLNQVYLNKAAPELSDPDVRKALSLAINREALLKSGYFGRGVIADGIVPGGDYWAAPPASVKSEYDPDRAKQLLAQAGKSDLSFDMIANADSATIRVAEILKEQWAAVGVTVNLRPLEIVQATNDYFNDRKAPALLSQWTGRPDPAMSYRLMFSGEGYFNTSDEGTPGLEKALGQADVSTEPQARKPGLDAAAEAVFADTPWLPLVFGDSLVGLGDDVKGFEGNLLGKPKFIGVSLG